MKNNKTIRVESCVMRVAGYGLRVARIFKPETRIPQLATLLFLLLIPTLVFSQQFATKSLGDYGNVTVMEVSGNYDCCFPN